MNYCQRHDFGFCEDHKDQCLSDDCALTDNPDVILCAICHNLLKPKRSRADAANPEEADPEQEPNEPDPDQQCS